MPIRLAGISPKAYEHPADRAATAALQAIPGLDALVRKLVELRWERTYRQLYLANAVQVGPDQLPDVWRTYERVLETLDMAETYDLYVTQWPTAHAAAIGAGKPVIVVTSPLLSLLTEDELRTEVAHILSQHVTYRTALDILLQLGRSRISLAALPVMGITMALLEWARASELSCDRATTLVNRDPLVTCRTLMVMAAGTESRRLNLDAFLRQAAAYEEWESDWDRMRRLLVELRQTHSFPVRRVQEVTRWVQSGEYDRILRGEYPRRGEQTSAREHAGDAVEYYRERFRAAFRETGESIGNAADRVTEWLRKEDASA